MSDEGRLGYVILEKARPYVRTKGGKLERVKGYRSRPKKADDLEIVRKPKKTDNLELARKLDELSGKGWSMKTDVWERNQVTAKFYDEKRISRGSLWLSIKKDSIYLDSFFLSEKMQGRGIGSKTLRELAVVSKGLGKNSINLDANGDVGTYAWAIMGFDFRSNLERKEVREHFFYFLDKKHIKYDREKIYHTWDIATFRGKGGKKVGKDFLLSKTIWAGSLSLKPRSKSWKIFDNYTKERG